MSRRGMVLLDQQPVGWVEETETGMNFQYDPDYATEPDARPISLTLPVREEAYVSAGLHPYFENLLPEGWLLDIALSELKLARGDAFGLLLALCRDCIGAVRIITATLEEAGGAVMGPGLGGAGEVPTDTTGEDDHV